MEISIVIPVLNEQGSMNALYHALTATLDSANVQDYEIIFVDDGSRDGTFSVLETLHTQDKRVKVIQFRRNFGKSAALGAALHPHRGLAALWPPAGLALVMAFTTQRGNGVAEPE